MKQSFTFRIKILPDPFAYTGTLAALIDQEKVIKQCWVDGDGVVVGSLIPFSDEGHAHSFILMTIFQQELFR